jgi:hypothetical protein
VNEQTEAMSLNRPIKASGQSEGEACVSHDQASWAAIDSQQGELRGRSITVVAGDWSRSRRT